MRYKLTITIFADASGRDQETWHALLTYRGEDRWLALSAPRLEEAESEVAELLASTPRLRTAWQPLQWSLATGAAQPMEGQVAETAVFDGFTLADVAHERSRVAA